MKGTKKIQPEKSWKPTIREGWQAAEDSGIPNPERGVEVMLKVGGSPLLRFMEGVGFYLYDVERLCFINGKRSDWSDGMSLICNYHKAPKDQRGDYTMRFTHGPAMALVKRLTRTEAAQWCIERSVPECLRSDAIALLPRTRPGRALDEGEMTTNNLHLRQDEAGDIYLRHKRGGGFEVNGEPMKDTFALIERIDALRKGKKMTVTCSSTLKDKKVTATEAAEWYLRNRVPEAIQGCFRVVEEVKASPKFAA